METFDYIIITGLVLIAIITPIGVILAGQDYDRWEATIDEMNCDELKDHYVQGTYSAASFINGGTVEQKFSNQQETELMKRIIADDCMAITMFEG